MLSDEEREAIEYWKTHMEILHWNTQLASEHYIKVLLDLVEKQQKEIEHWKAGMKIIEKDKNNHIERLERKIKELDSQNEVLEEIKTSYEKKTDKLLKEKVKKEKEIEELKTINQMQKYRIEVIDERELISKDTIKEILGIEENIDNEKLLSLLQTIVDENSRLEDIEDRKVQIEYNNVFNKGVKSVEDKIKAKIEEVDIQLQKLKDGLTGRKTNFVNKNMLFAQKKALQSLLEKE